MIRAGTRMRWIGTWDRIWLLSRLTRKIVLLVLILFGLTITITPFLVSLYLALMEHTSPILPYRFSPSEWTLYNFKAAWPNMHIGEYGLNSLIYAGSISIIVTLNSCLAGYIFARLDFPGKRFLWYTVLITMMIPSVVTVVPLLWQMIRFPLAGGNDIFGHGGSGFYDSWPGLILPGLFGSGATFLMRQFFLTLPPELEDAARVDGCGELAIFVRIMLPLATPGAVTVFLFEFQSRWNGLMWPLMITSTDRLRTLAVAFSNMSQLVFGSSPGAANPVHWAQAAAIMMALPIILLFIFGQRFFTRGIALTGIK